MNKNELIEKLQEIKGNPEIFSFDCEGLLSDPSLGQVRASFFNKREIRNLKKNNLVDEIFFLI